MLAVLLHECGHLMILAVLKVRRERTRREACRMLVPVVTVIALRRNVQHPDLRERGVAKAVERERERREKAGERMWVREHV